MIRGARGGVSGDCCRAVLSGLIFSVGFSSFSSLDLAQAALLRLSGQLEVGYGESRTRTDNFDSRTKTLDQRYTLGASGQLGKLGGYQLEASWFDQRLTPEDQDVTRFVIQSYRAGVNLFPTVAPLSLRAERIDRSTETGLKTDEQITTYSGNLVLDVGRLPRLNFNFQRSRLEPETGNDLKTTTAGVHADGSIQKTRVGVAYQFSDSDLGPGGSRSQAVNLNVNTELTSNLNFSGDARYSSTQTPSSVIAPGVSIFQERSVNLALSYRPTLHWWDGTTSYGYTENPFFEDFKSHVLQGGANFRPTDQTNASSSLRFTRFTLTSSSVESVIGDLSGQYRPIFGLTTGVGASGGLTNTETAGADLDSTFQNYRGDISYFSRWRDLQHRTAYNLTYGISDLEPGPRSTDIANGVAVGLSNTNTDLVSVGFDGNYSSVQRETDGIKSEQNMYFLQLHAGTDYFRNLMLRGDRLSLRARSSYNHTSGFGIIGRVIVFESIADYVAWTGLIVTANYVYEDYPNDVRLDRQTISGQLAYTTFLMRYVSLSLNLRESLEDNRYQEDVIRTEGTSALIFSLGQLSISANAQAQIFKIGDQETTTTFYFIRAIRTL